MKNTHTCPKCGSRVVLRIPDHPSRHASGNRRFLPPPRGRRRRFPFLPRKPAGTRETFPFFPTFVYFSPPRSLNYLSKHDISFSIF